MLQVHKPHPINAGADDTGGVQLTLVDLRLTVDALVAQPALTQVRVDAVHTLSLLARVTLALVNVHLTHLPCNEAVTCVGVLV